MAQLIQNAAAGSVLILVTVLLRQALRRKLPPETWLVLWAVCLFRLLTPVVPENPLSLYGLPKLQAGGTPPSGAALPTMPLDWSAPPGHVSTSAAPASGALPASPAWNWGAVLALLWLLGSAAAAVRYVLLWARSRQIVCSARLLPPSDPRYTAGIRLREGGMKGAAYTFGVICPTVVIPSGLSGAELACVLAHETIHARRRDNLWHYAAALVQTVFWWDPAVWLMGKLLRRDIELACDRAALKQLGADRRREYATILLSFSTQAKSSAFCRPFGQKQAEERIRAVMNYKKLSVCSIILAAVLVCCVSVGLATESNKSDEPAVLHVPSIQEIIQNGYPVNENGETYGPNVPYNEYVDIISAPDSLLAQNEDGVLGYVRHKTDYPLASTARNPEEAMAEMAHALDFASHTERDHYVNMYLEDGVTVIGRFFGNGDCPCAVAQNHRNRIK